MRNPVQVRGGVSTTMTVVTFNVADDAPSVVRRRHDDSTERPTTTPVTHLDTLADMLTTALSVYEAAGEGSDGAYETTKRLRDLAQAVEGRQMVVPAADYETAWAFVSEVSQVEIGGETFTADIGPTVPGVFDMRTCVREAATRDLFEMDSAAWDEIGAGGLIESSTGTVHLADGDASVCGHVDCAGADPEQGVNWLDVRHDGGVCSRCKRGTDRRPGRVLASMTFVPEDIAHTPVSEQ